MTRLAWYRTSPRSASATATFRPFSKPARIARMATMCLTTAAFALSWGARQPSDGRFTIHYYDTVLPVAPRTYVQILGHRLDQLETALGSEHAALLELKAVYQLLLTIPHRTETDPERLAARHRETEIAHQKFARLLETSGDIRDFITENVPLFNGTPGDPRSFDLLDELLHDQVYRLAYWRVAGEEINYRRFFDINALAAIPTEDPRGFAETHRLIFRLVPEGIVTGLRIDHPYGLYAPRHYIRPF